MDGRGTQANKERARAYMDEVFAGDPSAVGRHMTEDVEFTTITALDPGILEVLPWVGRKRGREEVKAYVARPLRNQETVWAKIDEVIGEGDTVAVFARLRTRGVSTGREAEQEVAFGLRFREGLISRYHLYENSYAQASLQRKGGAWVVENAENDGVGRPVPSDAAPDAMAPKAPPGERP